MNKFFEIMKHDLKKVSFPSFEGLASVCVACLFSISSVTFALSVLFLLGYISEWIMNGNGAIYVLWSIMSSVVSGILLWVTTILGRMLR